MLQHNRTVWSCTAAAVMLLLAVRAHALPAAGDEPSAAAAANRNNAVAGTENDLMDGIYSDCLRKDSVNCVKYKLFSFVDKMVDQRDTFALTDGVTVVKTAAPVVGSAAEAADVAGAPRGADGSIDSMIVARVQNFLQTHTIKVDLKGADVVNAVTATGRALHDVSDALWFDGAAAEPTGADTSAGESRKKKKHGKILGPLLLALGLKAAALLPLILGGIALIAGKALLIGKIALVLSAVIGLKKLLSQEKHVTYEVVAHPHHSSSHSSSHDAYAAGSGYSGDVAAVGAGGGGGGGYGSSGHGGWGRSVDVHDMAYAAQKPSM